MLGDVIDREKELPTSTDVEIVPMQSVQVESVHLIEHPEQQRELKIS